MIRLVAFDLDGTFLSSFNKYNRPRFKKVFDQLKAQGIKVVAISGNRYYRMAKLFKDYLDDMIFVADNGALIWNKGQVIHQNTFDAESMERLLAEYHYPGMSLSGLNTSYIEQEVPFTQRLILKFFLGPIRRVPSFSPLPEDEFVKLSFRVKNQDTVALTKEINQRLEGYAHATHSGWGTIDIVPTGISKQSALAFLGDRFGIEPDQMMVFGDGGNDIHMLEYAGHSYAMANASDRVKAAAKAVAPSNKEDGVLQVLEDFLTSSQ